MTARKNVQEWKSIFTHSTCLEGPVDGFDIGSLVKSCSFCDIFFLGTAELYGIVTPEPRAPEAVQAAVVEAGVARTPGCARSVGGETGARHG